MTTSRLSRYLVGVVVLCYLSATTAIICFFAFGATSTTMAEAFVPVTPTACPQSSPTSTVTLIQQFAGIIKNISGQTLQVVTQDPTQDPKQPPAKTINVTYSNATPTAVMTFLPASALKGTRVLVQAQLNPNKTYTALSVGQFPQGNPPNNLQGNSGCSPNKGSSTGSSQPNVADCFAKIQAQKISPANPPTSITIQNLCATEGTVQSVEGNTLTIIDKQNATHTITLVTSPGPTQTAIYQFTPTTASALKVGETVIIYPTNTDATVAEKIVIIPGDATK